MNKISIVLPELNYILLKYLDPYNDYKNLIINKYYHEIITNNKTDKLYIKFTNMYIDINFTEIDFMKACRYGYRHIIKYLYRKYKINISMHIWSS